MRVEKNLLLEGPNGRPVLTDIFMAEKESSKKILIFCHGYKGFKDWGPWNLMSETFMNSGISVVKFNFSFNGGTVEQPVDFPDLEAFGLNNYSKELQDLDVVLNFIEKDRRFGSGSTINHLALMGHSRGGGIASLKAADDPRVDMLITLAGVSDFESRFNIGSEEFRKWKHDGVKFVLNGRTKQQMPHFFQFYEDFDKNREKLNIQRALKSLNKPQLIIHGDSDNAVDVSEAYNMKAWNPAARLEIIKKADHVFGTRHPWPYDALSPELTEVLQLTSSFILSYGCAN